MNTVRHNFIWGQNEFQNIYDFIPPLPPNTLGLIRAFLDEVRDSGLSNIELNITTNNLAINLHIDAMSLIEDRDQYHFNIRYTTAEI